MSQGGWLESVAGTLQALKEYGSQYRAYRVLKTITLYHRIQGSTGIREAAEALEEYLLEVLPEEAEVESYSYTGRQTPEWLRVNAAWDVYDAIVEGPGWRLSLDQHPTLAAAHTPPSEGWVEASVAVAWDPLDPGFYEKNRDKIVMVTGSHGLAYRLAAEAGVPAVVLASESRHHEAAPYYGLFLTPEEAQRYTTTAVTLPWSLAKGLEGKRLRLRVDADLRPEPGRVPVVVAWMGDKEAPGPLVTAHLCHPAPGANDNASGVAAAVEAFTMLSHAIDQGRLEAPEGAVRLVLMPEYTGTLLALNGWLRGLATEALNLDMVGRAQGYSGPARLTYTPVTHGPSRVGDAFHDVALLEDEEARLTYYMAGSDHDAYIAYGVDSVMLNQWPDPFYHTSLDDADTISPQRLLEAARRAAATIYLLATGYQPTGRARQALLDRIVMRHLRSGDPAAAGLAKTILALRLGLQPTGETTGWTPVGDDRRLEASMPIPVFSSQTLGLDKALTLTRKLKGLEDHYQILLREAFYAAHKGYTVKRLHTELAAAYGTRRVTREYLEEGLAALEEAGLISLRG